MHLKFWFFIKFAIESRFVILFLKQVDVKEFFWLVCLFFVMFPKANLQNFIYRRTLRKCNVYSSIYASLVKD